MARAGTSPNMTRGQRNVIVTAMSSAFQGITDFFTRSRNVSNTRDDNVTEEEHRRNLMILQENTERLKELMKEFNTTLNVALAVGKLKKRRNDREQENNLPVAVATVATPVGGKRRSTRKKRRTKKRRRTRRRR